MGYQTDLDWHNQYQPNEQQIFAFLDDAEEEQFQAALRVQDNEKKA
jgi:hypothetical protein